MLKNLNKHDTKVSSENLDYDKLVSIKYFTQRGISKKTIYAPNFINRIFQKRMHTSAEAKTHTILFPLYEKLGNKIVGFKVCNSYFSKYIGDSKTGFWKSNTPITSSYKIILVSSPIEALSHFELSKNNLFDTMYIAIIKDVQEHKIKTFNAFLKKNKELISGVFLCYKNTLQGCINSINTIGQSSFGASEKNVCFSIKEVIQKTGSYRGNIHTAVVKIQAKKIEQLILILNNLRALSKNNLPYTSDYNEVYRSFSVKNDVIQFLVKGSLKNIKPIEDMAIEYKNSLFILNRPISESFSKDLLTKKSLQLNP